MGFTSPALDYTEPVISLDAHVIAHPDATYFFRADDDSMCEANIPYNALMVVDRSLEAKSGLIVVAVVDGELFYRRLEKTLNRTRLLPANKNYKPVEITEGTLFEVWGVVKAIVIDKPE